MRVYITVLILFHFISTGVCQSAKEVWVTTQKGCKVLPAYDAEESTIRWSGECLDGFAEGDGILEWTIDNVELKFTGTISNGYLEGNGSLSADATVFYGQFEKSRFIEGQKIFFKNGDTLRVETGIFKELLLHTGSRAYYDKGQKFGIEQSEESMAGELNGKASRLFLYDDGDTSLFESGTFEDGYLIKGRQLSFDGELWTSEEGEFVKGKLTGKGISKVSYEGKTLRTFEGIFPDATATGRGTLTIGYNRYEGTFEKGKISGYARVYFKDSLIYSGQMQKMTYHGKGHRWYLQGRQHVGYWKDGTQDGFGLSLWPDGSYYIGEFERGLFHGNGILTSPKGTVAGKWTSGENTTIQSPSKVREKLQKSYSREFVEFKRSVGVH